MSEDEWIPISVGEPKRPGPVLVTIKYQIGASVQYIVKSLVYYNGFMLDGDGVVTAWRPLPAPYKE